MSTFKMTTDGESFETSLESLLENNSFDPETEDELRALEVGQEYRFGGGAAAEVVLERVS